VEGGDECVGFSLMLCISAKLSSRGFKGCDDWVSGQFPKRRFYVKVWRIAGLSELLDERFVLLAALDSSVSR
jgi:hypothetical protein